MMDACVIIYTLLFKGWSPSKGVTGNYFKAHFIVKLRQVGELYCIQSVKL